jgi:hypothetical protein
MTLAQHASVSSAGVGITDVPNAAGRIDVGVSDLRAQEPGNGGLMAFQETIEFRESRCL